MLAGHDILDALDDALDGLLRARLLAAPEGLPSTPTPAFDAALSRDAAHRSARARQELASALSRDDHLTAEAAANVMAATAVVVGWEAAVSVLGGPDRKEAR